MSSHIATPLCQFTVISVIDNISLLGAGIATEELSSSPSTAPQSALMPQPDESLPAPTSPALSEDSDCLFRLDVDHVRSLMPQEKTVLPPVMNVAGGGSQLNEKGQTCYTPVINKNDFN